MKIAAVTTVKDECDIIELFIRINARYIDHFYIVDTGSSDPTLSILANLIIEGYPITLMKYESVDFQHPVIIMSVLRSVHDIPNYDWIALIDADEFILDEGNTLKEFLKVVPSTACAALNWKTFIPLGTEFHRQEAPLYGYVRQRAVEPKQFSKIIIHGSVAPQMNIANGNHLAADAQMNIVPQIFLPIDLGHVPVRSAEQIISKSLIGSHKQSIKANRGPGENFHWDQVSSYIRQNQYTLDHEKLRQIALNYTSEIVENPSYDLLERNIGSVDDVIRYPELAMINLTQRFDDFIGKLCGIITSNRE